MTDIHAIAKSMATQDNRATAAPIFVVQQRVRDYGYDSDYSEQHVWLDADEPCEVSDPELIARLDADYANGEDTPDFIRASYTDRWEFVTACFTHDGAIAYIEENRHNMSEPRIYVASGYRNREWQQVRDFLLAMEKNSP